MTADATEPAWNGYLVTAACPCGVVFEGPRGVQRGALSRYHQIALRIPRKIKALPFLLAERATDRATEREWKAQRYGRATERAQRSPPDKTAKTPSASLVGDRPTSWALTGDC